MKELWSLLSTFFLIASVTFGGGYAALPILIRGIVEKRKWLSEEELLDYFAVSKPRRVSFWSTFPHLSGYRRRKFGAQSPQR